jgi:hypothetical protein
MEYLPYKRVETNPRIQVYPNEHHGWLLFTTIEDGKAFLLEQAKSFIAYEESGKNTEHCVYDTETVHANLAEVKDGYFLEEVEDGYFLHKKVYGGIFYGTPYAERLQSYLLAPLARPVVKPMSPRERSLSEGKPQETVVHHDSIVQELKSLFASKKANHGLHTTGIRDRVVEKDTVYSTEEISSSDLTEDYTSSEITEIDENTENSEEEESKDEAIRELDDILEKISASTETENVPELEHLLFPDTLPKPLLIQNEQLPELFPEFNSYLNNDIPEERIVKQWSFEEYSSDHESMFIDEEEPARLHFSW